MSSESTWLLELPGGLSLPSLLPAAPFTTYTGDCASTHSSANQKDNGDCLEDLL